MLDARTLWIGLGSAVALGAAVCAPLGRRRRWPAAVMVPGVVVTAVLLCLSIVQAFGWHALHGFLLLLFPVHAAAFAAVAWRRRSTRHLLTMLIFLALTGVMWINYRRIDAPAWRVGLRLAAIGLTCASGVLLLRSRRLARGR